MSYQFESEDAILRAAGEIITVRLSKIAISASQEKVRIPGFGVFKLNRIRVNTGGPGGVETGSTHMQNRVFFRPYNRLKEGVADRKKLQLF